MFFQFLYLFLLFAELLLLILVCGFRFSRKSVFQFSDNGGQSLGCELYRFSFRSLILCYNLVNLLEQHTYFLL